MCIKRNRASGIRLLALSDRRVTTASFAGGGQDMVYAVRSSYIHRSGDSFRETSWAGQRETTRGSVADVTS